MSTDPYRPLPDAGDSTTVSREVNQAYPWPVRGLFVLLGLGSLSVASLGAVLATSLLWRSFQRRSTSGRRYVTYDFEFIVFGNTVSETTVIWSTVGLTCVSFAFACWMSCLAIRRRRSVNS